MKTKNLFLSLMSLIFFMSFLSCGNPSGGDGLKDVTITKVTVKTTHVANLKEKVVELPDATPFAAKDVSVMGKVAGSDTEISLEVESITPASVTPTATGADFTIKIKANATYKSESISLKAKIGKKELVIKNVLIKDSPADLAKNVMVLEKNTTFNKGDVSVIAQLEGESELKAFTVDSLEPNEVTIPETGEKPFTITMQPTAIHKGATITLKAKAGTPAKKGVTITEVRIGNAIADLKNNTIEFDKTVTKFMQSDITVMGRVDGELTSKQLTVASLAPTEVHPSSGESFTITTQGDQKTKAAIITLKPTQKK